MNLWIWNPYVIEGPFPGTQTIGIEQVLYFHCCLWEGGMCFPWQNKHSMRRWQQELVLQELFVILRVASPQLPTWSVWTLLKIREILGVFREPQSSSLPLLLSQPSLTSSSLIQCGQVWILGIDVFDPSQPLEPGAGGHYSYLKTESVPQCTELCGLKSIKAGWSESKAHRCFCSTVLIYFKCWFWALVFGTSRQIILYLVQISFVYQIKL